MLKKVVSCILVITLMSILMVPSGISVFAASLNLAQVKTGNIFYSSEQVQFIVSTDCSSIRYNVYDYWGANLYTGIVAVSGSITLTIPVSQKGTFKLVIDALSGSSVRDTLSTTFARVDDFDVSTLPANFPLAVQTHLGKNGTTASWSDMNAVIDLTKRLGFKNVRNTLRWSDIEDTTLGQYNFKPMHDNLMNSLQNNSMGIFFTAADQNSSLYTSWTPEFNTGFANYVGAVLNRYPGRIKWVEVGNELNTDLMGPPGTADEKAAIYFELLKAVYNKVKSIDPTIKVIGGATNEIGTTFFTGIFARGGLAYCDGISYHEYTQEPLDTAFYYTTLDNLVKTYNNNVSVPIYITECGYSTYSATAPEELDGPKNQQQARYDILRMMSAVANFKEGSGLASYYDLLNDTVDRTNVEANFGIFRSVNDPLGKYTPKWSYGAMAAMTRQMKDAVFSTIAAISGGGNSFVFSKNGQDFRFLYSVMGKYTVTADATASITVTDMMGNSTTVNPVDGKVSFDISEDPVYVNGTMTNLVSTAASSNYIYEAEILTSRGSDSRAVTAETNFSGGSGSKFNGNATGDYVEYDISVPQAGNYNILVRQKVGAQRGTSQLKVDGISVGGTYDSYDYSNYGKINNFGNATLLSAGTHTVRFDIVGKNTASDAGYTLFIDAIQLKKAAVTGVSLDFHTMTLNAGGATGTLTAIVLPLNAANKTLTWQSSNTSVALVDNGVITPVSVGTATITARTVEGNFTDTCSLTVNAYDPNEIVVDKYPFTADAYTQNVSPDWWYKNYGTSATELYTRNTGANMANDREIYIKVDCTAFAKDPNLINTAKLYLYGSAMESLPGTVTCYGLLDDSWTETGISYKVPTDPNYATFGPPSEAGISTLSTITYDSVGKWYSFDVTSFLKSQPDKILSFKIDGDTNGKMFKFYPREVAGSNATFKPYLEIASAAGPLVPVTGVNLNNTAMTLAEGGATGTLIPTITPSNASIKAVKWQTSNPAVATVNGGVVTPVAAGISTITVKTIDGNFTKTCLVTVQPTVASQYAVTADAFTLNNGTDKWKNFGTSTTELYTRNMGPNGANDREIYTKVDCTAITDLTKVSTAKLYLYGSAWESMTGTVTCYGLNDDSWTETGVSYALPTDPNYTALGPPSEAGISTLSTITYDGISKWYCFDVTDFVKSQSDKILSFKIDGDTNGKMYKFYPREYTVDTNKRPYLDVRTITDYIPVTGVSLDKTTMTLGEAGTTGILTPTVMPANASNKSVTWETSNAAVATVSGGVVTPLAEGTATITVRTVEGNYTDACAVTVQPTTPTQFPIIADAYTQNVSPDWWYRNYGTLATELYTRNTGVNAANDREIYVKVDCTAFTADPNSVSSAKLYLYGTAMESLPGTVTCYGLLDDSWTETGVSYKVPTDPNYATFGPPSETGISTLSTIYYDATGKYYSFDVTNFLKSQTDKILSFKIDGDTNGKMFKFYPREAASNKPYFEVRTINSSSIPVTGVSLNNHTLTLLPGATGTLIQTVVPTNATDKGVTWETSNAAAATVNDGVVTAVAPGTSTITVRTVDGNFTDTCVVTVPAPILLSQGKTVTASTEETDNPASYGNDGNLTSRRWSANATTYPQWWRVNLGASYSLNRLDTTWYGSSRAYKYKIEVSNDDSIYTTVVDKTGNTTVVNTSDAFTASARYVRVTVTGCSASGIKPSAYEFQVYGN